MQNPPKSQFFVRARALHIHACVRAQKKLLKKTNRMKLAKKNHKKKSHKKNYQKKTPKKKLAINNIQKKLKIYKFKKNNWQIQNN